MDLRAYYRSLVHFQYFAYEHRKISNQPQLKTGEKAGCHAFERTKRKNNPMLVEKGKNLTNYLVLYSV